MQKTVLRFGSLVTLLATPLLTFAQVSNFDSLIQTLTGYVDRSIAFLMGAAVLLFVYGVVKYMLAGGNEESIKEGKRFIIWGIVGIAVIVSVWGLVNLLTGSFGLPATLPRPPAIP